jgi:NADH-quinone oxidoreductase subunit J
MLLPSLIQRVPGGGVVEMVPPGDLISPWPRILFWAVLGTLVLGGAFLTITRRNAIAAVMSLVATFFGLAACYALLYAHFLAALQVLVYAGAIMVLFIFVVMVLNRDEAEPWAWRGVVLKGAVGVPAVVYATVKIGQYLAEVKPMRTTDPDAAFGTIENVGNILFTDYLFAFEAVSVLLLIAVIAAVVVARTHKQSDAAAAQEPDMPEQPTQEGH